MMILPVRVLTKSENVSPPLDLVGGETALARGCGADIIGVGEDLEEIGDDFELFFLNIEPEWKF